MWIIPKTLSQYAPATPGLSLESSEQAWMLEQSVTWRSKFMSRQYWSKRWRKGDYVRHLCGLMLKPSLHQSFVEKYTASLPDIHASRSVAQGSGKARMTQDTYGHISESTSGQLDLFGAFSKMSEVTPRWGYGESCPIWKKMVTERSGDCSVRRKQARLTNASDASFLQNYPTPEAHTVEKYSLQKDGQKKTQRSRNLTAMAINGELGKWATPQASDHVEGARTAKESNQKCLGRDLNQMENWPTPRAGNPGSRKPGTGGKILAEEAKQHAGPPAPEKSSTSGKNHGSPKLNPNWVEQLMGLSTGWTDLGSWGTESCRKPQN